MTETLGSIHFECPRCAASHERGYVDGVDTFRCLRCGYVGHGFHSDAQIDREIMKDIRAAQQWNVAHGLDAGDSAP